MRLLQAREEAKRMEIDKRSHITFELIGPEEQKLKCAWIDPHLGSFTIEGENGFHMVDDFYQKDPQVQNLKVEVKI